MGTEPARGPQRTDVPAGQTCDVCDAPLVPYLGWVRDPISGDTFSIPRCSVCGLGHTVPKPVDLGPYYPEIYYGNRHSLTESLCSRRRLRFLATATRSMGCPGSLLDVGCGSGSFLRWARRAGWRVAGTERNPAPARATGLDVGGTLAEIAGRGPFDCVTFWHSLEHMPNAADALGEASALLKPEGRLLVAVPDFDGLQARFFGRNWVHLDVPRHLYHFDRRALVALFEKVGFRPEKEWHQEFEYDLMGWSQGFMNAFIPKPNTFFDLVTGKAPPKRRGSYATLLVSGALLSLFFLPAVGLGTALKLGGTLVMSASRGAD